MATQISSVVPVLKNGVHLMTSDFGRRTITVNGVTSTGSHQGVDMVGKGYACDYIIAAAPGKVVIAGYSDSAGYYVRIDHGNGVFTRYLHMQANSLKVKVGDTVAKGQVLGYMGSTGRSTGAHLHFDVNVNGSYVDPKPYLAGTKLFPGATASGGNSVPAAVEAIYQVYAGGRWWGEIAGYNNFNSNGYAGVFGKEISGIRVKLTDGKTVTVRSHVCGEEKEKWLSEITKWDNSAMGYSGILGKALDCVTMKAAGHTLRYRVHVKGGGWLGWISKSDINDYNNGLAGAYEKPIDAIQIDVV